MTVTISLAILAVTAILAIIADRGLYNLLDYVALKLHRFAVRGRARQSLHANSLADQWARDMEIEP